MNFVTCTSRSDHVDGEPRRGRRKKCGWRVDRPSVAVLPTQPDVLDDVLGVGRVAHDSIRDAEQARALTREEGNRLVELDQVLLRPTSGVCSKMTAGGCQVRLAE